MMRPRALALKITGDAEPQASARSGEGRRGVGLALTPPWPNAQ